MDEKSTNKEFDPKNPRGLLWMDPEEFDEPDISDDAFEKRFGHRPEPLPEAILKWLAE